MGGLWQWVRGAAVALGLALAPVAALGQETGAGSALVVDAQPVGAGKTAVEAGAYVLRIDRVSPRDGSFNVDLWLWFRWQGADKRPHETFELPRGIVTGRTDTEVLDDGGFNYATVRVQATIYHDFDVRRFPLDDHTILIEIEDAAYAVNEQVYVTDPGTALDPGVRVAGWQVGLGAPAVAEHRYPTNYGFRAAGDEAAVYSRLVIPVTLERTSIGPLFKLFWVTVLSVLLSLLSLMVKADDLDARFGMGVGAIFAASANAVVISAILPDTTVVTMAEQINLIAVLINFAAVFVSIWSLRLRYQERDEASVRLDMVWMWSMAVLYVLANAAVLAFDLSW
jgi:hypothetical protein